LKKSFAQKDAGGGGLTLPTLPKRGEGGIAGKEEPERGKEERGTKKGKEWK